MPEELCQVSPKSHNVSLASHSDPSPYQKMKNEILGIVHVKVGVKAGAGGREGVEALLVIGVTLCHLQAGLSPTKEPPPHHLANLSHCQHYNIF